MGFNEHVHIYILFMSCTYVIFILQYHGQGEKYSEALDYLNMIFTGVFGVEFILKFAALRTKVIMMIGPSRAPQSHDRPSDLGLPVQD